MRKLTNEEFIKACVERHEGFYSYANTSYNNYYGKVKIECPIHGEFEQRAGDHKRGNGCYNCGNNVLTTQQFIEKANVIHSSFPYDYSLVNYIDVFTPVNIRCIKHDFVFSQPPRTHLIGRGCPECAKEKNGKAHSLTGEGFIERARKIHEDLYSYDNTSYRGIFTHVMITCKIHGEFPQTPNHHLSGNGCPKCSHRVSKPEIAWLQSLDIDKLETQKKLHVGGKEIKVDGFDPNTNTVYEFYGDFWHGNPDVYDLKDMNRANKTQYKILYDETIEREEHLKSFGYNVVSIWENDWKKRGIQNEVQ